MIQLLVHYSLHLVFPFLLAYIFFPKQFWKVYFIFLLAMLIDLDHLLATPVFDPSRCSIGFHPLHSYWALAVYVALLIFKKTRIIALALLWHLAVDFIDCQMM
ncbi:DUF6122 family protein [Spongiivirga citrea]|uniref:Metal-dependent hydrolase n=1 Tax=Spongiivirga citrea TaxID=1481457 RepID=A0A6M0CJP7_9FLAO|nr:DUF6122 family protein [Spongiivirga citrea]NER15677.1 hypothetical protein [Spongiivirga citrea]